MFALLGVLALAFPTSAESGRPAGDEALLEALEVGDELPPFALMATDGLEYSLAQYADAQAAVVLFIGNNCPCVEAYDDRMVWMSSYLAKQGVPVLAINANKADRRWGESLVDMEARADSAGYNFPYLIDEDQAVAKAFRASRTPEAFVLGRRSPAEAGSSPNPWRLVYSGAIDDQPSKPEQVHRHYVNEAVHRFLAGQNMQPARVEPMGCAIEGVSVQAKACPMEAMESRVRSGPTRADVSAMVQNDRPTEHILPVRVGSLDAAWLDLRAAAEQLYADPQREEAVLDLLQASTVDSVYARKRARHRVVGGALLPYFGVRWKTVRYTREQVVGQVVKQSISGKERFTEYDVNFNLVPHLPRSLEVVHAAYADQQGMFKARKKVRKAGGPDAPPYIKPVPDADPTPYKIHVEVTPMRDLRDTLHEVFYPTRGGLPLVEHPNIQRSNPVFGVYGPMVLDCNHKCHPEIHPYEWIWWRRAPKQEGGSAVWSLGFLRDVSNRMKHWSSAPREGAVRIPVVLDFGQQDALSIRLEAGPRSGFSAEGLWRWPLPASAAAVRGQSTWSFEHPALSGKTLELVSDQELPIAAAWWWMEDAVWDADRGLLRAYLVLALSVEDAFTGWLHVP